MYMCIHVYIYTLFKRISAYILYTCLHIHMQINTSSARTRRGGSCLKNIYKAFLIYRTCMRRAPAKPCVRALCESGVLFHMSHLKLHFALHSPHFTLPTALFPLHTPHFTLHSPHFTLETSQSTLHTSHCFFHIPHSTLHTALFTPHTSHCTLHTPHFISFELFSPYPISFLLISSSLLICHASFHESLPSTTTKELACAVRQPGPCVRALCEAVAVLLSKKMTCARPRCNANTFLTIHIALFTPHTPHFTLALHLNSSHLSSSHLIPCLPICQLSSSWLFLFQVLPSTDVYYKSLQKPLPSTTLYYKACTKHFPVLLCTTKLAQSTPQYYFVLQSLRKLLPSTTVYYKSLQKELPSITLYYKASTHIKFFRRETFTRSKLFKQRSFYTQKLLHTTSFFTEKLSHTASVYTQNTYTQCFYTWQAFTHRNFCTETLLHTDRLLHTASFYTQNLFHTASFQTQQAFTHRTLTHSAFTHGKRLHTQQAF